MSKNLGLLRSILIVGMFLTTNTRTAEAFGFIPPLPPEPVTDAGAQAGEIASNATAIKQKVEAAYSKMSSMSLDSIKGEFTSMMNPSASKEVPQNPGTPESTANSELGIAAGDMSEEAFYKAHNELFFKYPPKSKFGIDSDSTLQTAYKRKGVEYRQDVLIDTYLTARTMESYLEAVERTIDRLASCQANPDPSKCTFFGMTMEKVESSEQEPDGEGENPGQLGATKNAYIVTMVYDRLMRIVEDLTATEAIYQSSRQTNMADPVASDQQSSAEDYLPVKYQFASKTIHEHQYAKKAERLNVTEIICRPGDKACPTQNQDGAEPDVMDNTEILIKLKPIEQALDEALMVHNMKNQLPTYKVQYRKYLRAIEIHKRTMQTVYDSDQCVVNFLDKHSNIKGIGIAVSPSGEYLGQITNDKKVIDGKGKIIGFVKADNKVIDNSGKEIGVYKNEKAKDKPDWKSKWGSAKSYAEEDISNYDKRKGTISYDLIKEYQDRVMNTVLETKDECDGYYLADNCPDGYKSDLDNPCESNKELYPCVIASGIEFDESIESQIDANNIAGSLESGIATMASRQLPTLSRNETDYVTNSSDMDKIATSNRIRAEWPWRIGAKKVMELTENGLLSFKPWNDQKDMQVQYLRQKYKNINNIIKTTDKGINSYKIANALSGGYSSDQDDALKQEMQTLIKKILECKTVEQAKLNVKNEYCAKYGFSGSSDTMTRTDYIYRYNHHWYQDNITLKCKVTTDANKGTVKFERQEMSADHKDVNTVEGTIYQVVSEDGSKCTYKNDISKVAFPEQSGCPGVWDFTKSFLVKNYLPAVVGQCKQNAADYLYTTAMSGGRIVAQNKLAEVLAQRMASENIVNTLIRTYDNEQNVRRAALNTIKSQITALNTGVNTATKEKNILKKEQGRAESRIESINDEINMINQRQAPDPEAKCAADYQKMVLNYEKSCIDGTHEAQWVCPSSCATLKKTAQPEACRGLGKVACDDPNKGYVTTISKMLKAKFTKNETEETKKITKLYIIPNQAKVAIAERQSQINSAKQRKKSLQEEADKKQKEIDDATEVFVASEEEGGKYGKSYIVTAEAEQANVEAVNEKFENFLSAGEDNRMYHRDVEHCAKRFIFCLRWEKPTAVGSDNLENTLVQIFGYDDDDIRDTIKAKMEAQWINPWTGVINSVLNSTGTGLQLPTKFALDDSFTQKILPLGRVDKITPLTLNDVTNKIKEVIVSAAANDVKTYIRNGDMIISYLMDSAQGKVAGVTNSLGISQGMVPTDGQKDKIISRVNYKDTAEEYQAREITNVHEALVKNLRIPDKYGAELAAAGLDLGELFGIPQDIEKLTENEYFAALPARGANYPGRPSSDVDAGRDYRAPKGPLMSLPPVREVFYFDAQDYKDIPMLKGKDKPALAYLLNKKFPNDTDANVKTWEYMPEVWRYLLARTNIRNDGKYQQTFVERSYALKELQNLTENKNVSGAKASHYGTIIGRGGVYPCVLSGFNVVDMDGTTSVSSLKFKQDKQKNASNLVKLSCKEIGVNKRQAMYENVISKENLCYLYNSKKSGICHLLADHGKNKDTQTSISKKNIQYYDGYSELGQFLKTDSKGIHYRDLQRSIAEYLQSEDEDKTANTITRQKAELSSFKRNIMGTFLESVNAEHAAKKLRDNLRVDLTESMKSLCSQIHKSGKSVSSSLKDENYLKVSEEAQEELDKKCAEYLVNGRGEKDSNGIATGLAYAATDRKDTRYGSNGEFKDKNNQKAYGGITCHQAMQDTSYYEDLYCKLDDLKDEKLAEIKSQLASVKNMRGKNKDYVKERLADIERKLTILTKDKDEVVYLTPGMDTSEITGRINTAKADRGVERAADEESITAMDNGTQSVPYCPNY